MIVHDVPQRSPEWFRLRWGKVGGSDAARLGTDSLFHELLGAMLEECQEEDTYTSPAMQRGQDLEPFALQAFAEPRGLKLHTPGWIECRAAPLLGISPDACTEDYRTAVEVKCPGMKNHAKYLLEGVLPLEYVSQCVHYFTVIDTLQTLHFISYRWESSAQIFHVELFRDSKVNVGTERTPVMMTIAACVDARVELANEIQNRLDEALLKILLK